MEVDWRTLFLTPSLFQLASVMASPQSLLKRSFLKQGMSLRARNSVRLMLTVLWSALASQRYEAGRTTSLREAVG